MKYTEIMEAVADLGRVTFDLETAFEENGGELNDDTYALQLTQEALQTLLKTDGIDSLGRWLKAKQDEIATAKAEKAAADRRIKALQNTEDFIKREILSVMNYTHTEEAKGSFYKFTIYESKKTSVNIAALEDEYLAKVRAAARAAGLPECIDIQLKTTTGNLEAAGDMERFIDRETGDAIKFTKPRAAKE